MELGPDEEFWMKRPKPPPGCVTISALSKHLGIYRCVLHGYLKKLGIELGPFVRDEPYFTKPRVYKKRHRLLTQDEIKRVIEHHYATRPDPGPGWDD